MCRNRNARYAVGLLLVLGLVLAGCGDSTPSLIGKWQNISGGSIGSYGQVIEFVDGSNVDLGTSAATYKLIDNTHLRMADPTTSVIFDMKLDGDHLTLASDGKSSTFAHVSGSALPLTTMPSPVGGKWRLVSASTTLYLGDSEAQVGNVIRFDGDATGGTVSLGSFRMPYTVSDPTHITLGNGLYNTYAITTRTARELVLEQPVLFGTETYTFAKD